MPIKPLKKYNKMELQERIQELEKAESETLQAAQKEIDAICKKYDVEIACKITFDELLKIISFFKNTGSDKVKLNYGIFLNGTV